jgi:phosphoribosylaminoimidazolecarboxamide formyltransferase/IMP cyclohydrolase
LALRKKLSAKAFARTGAYDAAISNWYAEQLEDRAPAYRALGGKLRQSLRYGENPHQSAAFYVTGEQRFGVATAKQLQGKELSYNNLNDTDAAFELVAEFDPKESAAVAIIKHANPCGVAHGADLLEAYKRAFECDSVSAFGGIVALNRRLDKATAGAIADIFTEVVIAPEADEDAVAVFAKKKNLRLLVTGGLPDPATPGLSIKTVAGGFLAQNRDNGRITGADLKFVTKRKPDDAQIRDMIFAFKVAKHVKSNAIIYARDGATVGIGAGQMSRVDSARVARLKAEDVAHANNWSDPKTIGSVCASDAFFPFPDGLLQAAQAGSTAVIQPGGSIRDEEVIKAADDADLAMAFTGMRHFRH